MLCLLFIYPLQGLFPRRGIVSVFLFRSPGSIGWLVVGGVSLFWAGQICAGLFTIRRRTGFWGIREGGWMGGGFFMGLFAFFFCFAAVVDEGLRERLYGGKK